MICVKKLSRTRGSRVSILAPYELRSNEMGGGEWDGGVENGVQGWDVGDFINCVTYRLYVHYVTYSTENMYETPHNHQHF